MVKKNWQEFQTLQKIEAKRSRYSVGFSQLECGYASTFLPMAICPTLIYLNLPAGTQHYFTNMQESLSHSKQLMVNGHLVNVIRYHKTEIAISFEEAERLITCISHPGFVIYNPTFQKTVTPENLDFFRTKAQTNFLIRNEMTDGIADSVDIEFTVTEEGFNCISSIKAHLERLGRYVDYDETDIRESVGDYRLKNLQSMELATDGEVLVPYPYGRKQDLSSLLMENRITTNDLLILLKGLERIRPLNITACDLGATSANVFTTDKNG